MGCAHSHEADHAAHTRRPSSSPRSPTSPTLNSGVLLAADSPRSTPGASSRFLSPRSASSAGVITDAASPGHTVARQDEGQRGSMSRAFAAALASAASGTTGAPGSPRAVAKPSFPTRRVATTAEAETTHAVILSEHRARIDRRDARRLAVLQRRRDRHPHRFDARTVTPFDLLFSDDDGDAANDSTALCVSDSLASATPTATDCFNAGGSASPSLCTSPSNASAYELRGSLAFPLPLPHLPTSPNVPRSGSTVSHSSSAGQRTPLATLGCKLQAR